jgi:multisubunit Na+/H+ antiporter MnhG subunit
MVARRYPTSGTGHALRMAGPVVFLGFVLVAAILFVVGVNAFFLVPLVVIALVTLFWAPIIAAIGGSSLRSGPEPGGVPDTREASYDPQMRPEERRPA